MYATEYGNAGGKAVVLEPENLGFKWRPGNLETWMREQDWISIINPKTGDRL